MCWVLREAAAGSSRLHHQAHHHACALLQIPGLVNVDFADVRTIMCGAGTSLMGQGVAAGKDRAREAALKAIQSPLLEVGIERATGIVWNITGPSNMTLFEVGDPAPLYMSC
jgi:cell division protein FtsZ